MNNLSAADLPFGRPTKWFVTHVELGSGHIFCQLNEPSISAKYDKLSTEINAWSKAGKLQQLLGQPRIGELCLSNQNDLYFRSQVTSVDHETRTADAYFYDSGSTGSVPYSHLYELPEKFSNLPAAAFECKLADVEPILGAGRWDEKSTDLIKELVFEQELVGVAEKLLKNIVIIRLYAGGDTDVTVAEQLISAGLGRATKAKVPGSISSRVSGGSGKKSSNSFGSMRKPRPLKMYKQLTFAIDQYVDICFSHYTSMKQMFFQPADRKEALCAMQESIQSAYMSNTAKTLTELTSNAICCAKFSEDGKWYRGQVQSSSSAPGTKVVYFVDFGNTDVIQEKEIKELIPQFLNLPAMAISCSLANVNPPVGSTDFQPKTLDWFVGRTSNKGLVGQVVSSNGKNGYNLVIYDSVGDPKETVNDELVRLGFGSSVLDTSLAVNNSSSSPSAKSNPLIVGSMIRYVHPSIDIGKSEDAYVAFSVSPHLFYMQLVCSTDLLNQLMLDIASMYKNLGPNSDIIKQPLKGMACATQFSDDNEYYRGEIMEISDAAATVSFALVLLFKAMGEGREGVVRVKKLTLC